MEATLLEENTVIKETGSRPDSYFAVSNWFPGLKCYECREDGLEPHQCGTTLGRQVECPPQVETCYVREESKFAFYSP